MSSDLITRNNYQETVIKNHIFQGITPHAMNGEIKLPEYNKDTWFSSEPHLYEINMNGSLELAQCK